jgi:hypothetical protein
MMGQIWCRAIANQCPACLRLHATVRLRGGSSLGIPDSGYCYQRLRPDQNPHREFGITSQFIRDTLTPSFFNVTVPVVVDFINYGDTPLVYVARAGEVTYCVLVSQPCLSFGLVRREFDNLIRLASPDPVHVVAPTRYTAGAERELFVAPYYYQARCIATQHSVGWGLYVPEPAYHFQPFQSGTADVVCACMIALLIRLHDGRVGIAAAKLGGGDFIIEKEWDGLEPNVDNTLRCMKLIAARDTLEIGRKKYVEILRKEFVKRTYYEDEDDRDKSVLVNWKARVPMSDPAIEMGIQIAGDPAVT